ncbi:MAG: CRISPR-associated protein Cas4 [Betaproteobacteria bacterium]|uniref:CRISPR-associated protein Cas4 n=1 Tax=Thiomonas sp. TaxID=2047785 RepID=UPI00258FDCE0|nr:CRISPR-associated protein Cas4 [Thiomonas sp.]MDA8255549.1 CRISPR-associated protein Cas4 [Betaproteobacteria bacterium]
MNELEAVPLSALNHWAYCPHRCGLIHLDGQFTNNIHTARGNAEHARVDRVSYETAKSGARIEYALPVWSDRLGLIGKCDAVEFWPDGTIYPVEYKHGPKRKWLNDDLQLAAQAMCLEDMLGRPVHKGAIFHASSHRRREVPITPMLRATVVETAVAIRTMLDSGVLPAPVFDARCRECSLREICQPEALTARGRQSAQRLQLFDVDAP